MTWITATSIALAAIASLTCGHVTIAAEFHVAPAGNSAGDGSRQRPWDLQTALAHPKSVEPGDTIWLHEGMYRGSFKSELRGREDARITVQQAPGERAIIELEPTEGIGVGFYAYGEWTRYQGFEVTCTNPQRRTELKGSWPDDLNRGSVEGRGSHLQFVNLLVHDLGSGFGFWSEAVGGEIYGCLIYNNGWGGPDRGHGHGIYAQNKNATKIIEDNIIFAQFGSGVHVYGSPKASLKGFRIVGNISYLNGCLFKPGDQTTSILVGGDAPLEDVLVAENMVYAGGLQLGYPWGHNNTSLVVLRNYTVGMSLYFQNELLFEENTIVAGRPVLRLVQTENGSTERYEIDKNSYFNTETDYSPFAFGRGDKSESHSLETWQKLGFDTHSKLHEGAPSEAAVFVRSNRYEQGRAHIAVFNWGQQPEVAVDLQNVLKPGQRFRIVSARNFHGPAVLSGVYEGKPLALPLKTVAPAQPVGMPDYKLPVTEPQFGAFVVLSQ